MDEVIYYFAEKTWKLLENAIHEINNDNSSGLSFEELHRYVFIAASGDRLSFFLHDVV
jgi:cullin 3